MDKELLKPQKMRFWNQFCNNSSIKHSWQVTQPHQCFSSMSSPLVLHGFALSSQSRCFSWTLFYRHDREYLFFCVEKASYVWSVISESSKILDSPSAMVLLPHKGPSWTPTLFSAALQAPVLTEDRLSTGQNLVQSRPTFLLFLRWHFVYLAQFPNRFSALVLSNHNSGKYVIYIQHSP